MIEANDAQTVPVGMLKDILAQHAEGLAAKTAELQNQITALLKQNSALKAHVAAASVKGSSSNNADVMAILWKERERIAFQEKVRPVSPEYTAIERSSLAGYSTTTPAIRAQARAMSLVQAEQTILKLKVAHDRYEEVHTAYEADKVKAVDVAGAAVVGAEYKPLFVQAQKELSDAFTRGIAVSQTRRRIYGVLRLEPHLRCFIGDFDKEAALLDNP